MFLEYYESYAYAYKFVDFACFLVCLFFFSFFFVLFCLADQHLYVATN